MGSPESGCSGFEFRTYPPYLSPWVLGAFLSLLGWVQYNLGKKIFLCQKFLPTLRNAPMGSKGSFTGSKMVKNFRSKIDLKLNILSNSDEKTRTCILGDFLGPKVMIPKILGSAEISTARSVFLKFWSCGSKNFKKFSNFKMVKNDHFSTFVVFLLLFGQSGLSCTHLPNFASQKFLRAQEIPHENWHFGFKLTYFNLSN